jgi:hypothetical protein
MGIPQNVRFWTVKEAATFLRVSDATIRRMSKTPRKKGGPPVVRPSIVSGKKNGWSLIRFPREEFIAWAERET